MDKMIRFSSLGKDYITITIQLANLLLLLPESSNFENLGYFLIVDNSSFEYYFLSSTFHMTV